MRAKYLLVSIILGSLLGVYATPAQTPKTRRNRNPAQPGQPVNQELPPVPRILSTAEDQAADEETTPTQQLRPISVPAPQSKSAAPERQARPLRLEDVVIEQDAQRRSLNKLSGNVNTLVTKIGFLEAQQRQTFTLQRLMYSEQRAETMRQQLLDTQNKEIDIQRELEQNEYNLRPEVIERSNALFGSTRPDEMRALRRAALEKERERLLAQQQILRQNRERLQLVVTRADEEVDKLRTRLDKENDELRDNFEQAGQPGNPPATRPAKPTINQETPTEP